MATHVACESIHGETVGSLLRRYRQTGDRAACEQLVGAHLSLVQSLARRFLSRGDTLDDLVQVGSIGLLKALRRFDPDRGSPFRPYAAAMIVGELRHHVRDPKWPVRIPRRVRQLSHELERPAGELGLRLARPPTPSELARETGLPEPTVVRAIESRPAQAAVSLSAQPGEARAADDPLAAAEARLLVEAGFRLLDERDRAIVGRYFFTDLSQAEIAAELGISQIHVSRLLRRALSRLRAGLDERPETAAGLSG